jgi:hypothetical protein
VKRQLSVRRTEDHGVGSPREQNKCRMFFEASLELRGALLPSVVIAALIGGQEPNVNALLSVA